MNEREIARGQPSLSTAIRDVRTVRIQAPQSCRKFAYENLHQLYALHTETNALCITSPLRSDVT